jgi:mono/diheme cytochrome c family protein
MHLLGSLLVQVLHFRGQVMRSEKQGRVVVAIAGAVVLASQMAAAQAPAAAPSGSAVFRLYCASCHGTSAKGDGPLASSMTRKPANLTEIAKRNDGVFPADQVARTIDGRNPPRGHGGGDMPVWGPAFAKSASTSEADTAEQRIQRLVSYLESIQVK